MNEKALNETLSFLKNKGLDRAEVGIILGTGLGKLIDEISIEQTVDYADIPNFPEATVESHLGRLVFGELAGKRVVAMQGRFHYYEGYSAQQITFPVRILHQLGIRFLLVSNAAGAVNLNFKKGELMLIKDHINLLPENPLRGANIEKWGPRFPDISCPYNQQLQDKLIEIAANENINLYRGVYAAVPGPNLETPAEYKYLKIIGADAVGMSTVPEVIVANHVGLACCAISVLTDECDPENLAPVEIPDILAQAAKAEPQLIRLTKKLITSL